MIKIVLDASQSPARTVSALPEVLFFETRVNGKKQLYMNRAHVKIVRGDRIELVGVTTNLAKPSEIVVNFKGYVGSRNGNTGEDRGYVIHTGRDLWKRYSLAGKGKEYQVVVTRDNTLLGRLFVELAEPQLDYIILQVNHGVKHCLFPGDSLSIDPKDTINILDVKTNISTNTGVQAFLKGAGTNIRLFSDGAASSWTIGSDRIGRKDREYSIVVQREHTELGFINVNFDKGARYGG
jgi:hypothetical protein